MPSVDLEALQKKGKTHKIMRALDHRDPSVRAQAIRLLSQSDRLLLYPRLFDLAKDEDPSVRFEAVRALGAFEDERSLNSLASVLHDTDGAVREQAAKSMEIVRKKYYQCLAYIIGSPDHHARYDEAIAKLREAGSEPAAIDAMLEVIERESWGRHALAELLIEIGEPRAFPLLKRLADRGKFEGYGSMIRAIDDYIAAHKELQEPVQFVTCALCGKRITVRNAKYFGPPKEEQWFCVGSCWSNRDKVLTDLASCPFLRKGNCLAGGECTLRTGLYFDCYLYHKGHY